MFILANHQIAGNCSAHTTQPHSPFWKYLRLGDSEWNFWGLILWSRDFFGVWLEALGIFLGFDFCPFDHPRHLKSITQPLPEGDQLY